MSWTVDWRVGEFLGGEGGAKKREREREREGEGGGVTRNGEEKRLFFIILERMERSGRVIL